MSRVVITGLGLVSSIGNNVSETWDNLITGKSGIKKISSFDVSDLPCKIAGYISHNEKDEYYVDRSKYLETREINRNDRFIQYGLIASKMAVEDAGLMTLDDKSKLRVGVSVGSGIGGLETIYNGSITLNEKGSRKISPFFIPSSLINLTSGQISIKFGFKGPNHSVVTACATGAHSIGDAAEMIKRGAAEIMIAGGSEAAVCKLGVAGFCAARSLSTKYNDQPAKASRPWDKDRDGFVIGEGAGIVVLEDYENAKKRGAKIYAELIGYGMSGDAHHITTPSEDGSGGFRAMSEALKMSSVNSDEINYINAHGTSTLIGDDIELSAIMRLTGGNDKIKISSTKSSIGHLLGAAGSVEAIITILSIKHNIVPATLNLYNPSHKFKVDLVPHNSIDHKVEIALSNSFGFGGTNTALLFKSI
ncbi:MAG: 3-oxoacyl-[acyl-carrier-protein] synthase 2 [Alphaproteobacteria bacterium MarineAlpha5_Bin1]|jgi:3-oxoacyl-[acyl-carrier-protein] synthase II|nr:MAG: 3-oxoacyl-[acyl-carrier-protein] synthase 2 [Alphaproteobacteria bacterium MarineAlpha5_Bin1]|tara:strand:+ start:3167 stop:4423 length:1257 start_codon:yes stop_codon:yes gene_type:complete